MGGLDLRLFQLINGWAGRVAWLDELMRLLINDYLIPTAISLILLALWFDGPLPGRRQNQQAVVRAALAVGLANSVVRLYDVWFFRARPFTDHDVTLLFYRPTVSAFPSVPATTAFAFAAAVWPYNRRAGIVLFVMAGLWGFARVFGGVHWPSDIVAGAVVGIASAWLVIRLRVFDPLVNGIIAVGQRLNLA